MSDAAEATTQAVSSLPVTVVIFGVISLVLYFWLLKPLLTPPVAPPEGTTARRAVDAPARVATNTTPSRRSRNTPTKPTSGSDIRSLLEQNTRCPPHMAPASAKYLDTGGISLLSEGVLPFRHSRAAAYEQASSSASQNRKDRARVLSRILAMDNSSSSAAGSKPPARGSTIVITISTKEVGCEKLRRAIYLLSTHFNTMVILTDVSSPDVSDLDLDALVVKLRGSNPSDLPQDVLPRHRIVAAQSITGRVAFCRQLGRVEFVLDPDAEMQTQLGRFGFRVLVYGKDGLGNVLMS